MRVCVELRGWADDLIGNNDKVKFAIRLALLKSGRDYGATIGVFCKAVGDSSVYNPYQIDVRCESVTSIAFDNSKGERSKVEVHEFSFVAKRFSVPSIYEAAFILLIRRK